VYQHSKALMLRTCRVAHLSLCLSMCVDPDAVLGGEWGGSRNLCI